MQKATAFWLLENTTLTFKQIAKFCNLHELEVKGIADGDVAKGIKAYNPILAGQLSREEIEIWLVDVTTAKRELIMKKRSDNTKPDESKRKKSRKEQKEMKKNKSKRTSLKM